MCLLLCLPKKIRPSVIYKNYGIKVGSGISGTFLLFIGCIRHYMRAFYINFMISKKNI